MPKRGALNPDRLEMGSCKPRESHPTDGTPKHRRIVTLRGKLVLEEVASLSEILMFAFIQRGVISNAIDKPRIRVDRFRHALEPQRYWIRGDAF